MNGFTSLAIEHLLVRLKPLNRAMRRAVDRQAAEARRLIRPDVKPLCVTDDQVHDLLNNADQILKGTASCNGPASLSAEEFAAEEKLREKAGRLGVALPLDQLAEILDLSGFELEAILLCAAPEIDRSYERIYAYILDDLNRRLPCAELLSTLTANSLKETLVRRFVLGRFGKLQRLGLLQKVGDHSTELRQEFHLAPAVFDFLLGKIFDVVNLLKDPADVAPAPKFNLPPEVDESTVNRVGAAIRKRELLITAFWGHRHSARNDLAYAIAAVAGMRLRRFLFSELLQPNAKLWEIITEQVQTASALDAILWIETDVFEDTQNERIRDALEETLCLSGTPFILTGRYAWRPSSLLENHNYMEFELALPSYEDCKLGWEEAIPELDSPNASALATKFRLNSAEMRAVARVAKTRAHIFSNGHRSKLSDQIETACATVTRKRADHYASVIKTRRTADELILPPDLHKQVVEIASFFQVWSRVDEEWGFARVSSRGNGVKALFTGEPGTGKSLAAEVIAGILQLPLLKVDLARITSKWVGETEKNLDTVFREAEESHAVLLFDEADSLFGKRAEVQHGTDRYANLEVGYLLQRLEEFFGLVILSSNLKEHIDSAFLRRFQVVIDFPFPGMEERLRIWKISFPQSAPLDLSVDLEALQELELTGAGIVSAARTAALLAADAGANSITMQHIIRAVARQFRREARILPLSQLGSYASFIQEV